MAAEGIHFLEAVDDFTRLGPQTTAVKTEMAHRQVGRTDSMSCASCCGVHVRRTASESPLMLTAISILPLMYPVVS